MENVTKYLVITMAIAAAVGFGYANLAEAAYTPDTKLLASYDAASNTTQYSAIGAWTVTRNAGYKTGGVLHSDPQNNEVVWVFYAPDSRPRIFNVAYNQNTGQGIMTIAMNGQVQGTLDMYSSVGDTNHTASNITLNNIAEGMNALKIGVYSKNAASGTYQIDLLWWYLK